MDVVALEAVPLAVIMVMRTVVTVRMTMIMIVRVGQVGHTAPTAVAAPFFGGMVSKPLTGWSRYGNTSR